MLFAIAVLAGIGAPMTVVQVLTVNLLTDGLPAVALARDPASPTTMPTAPRGHGTRSSRAGCSSRSALSGVAVGLAATGRVPRRPRDSTPDAAQTMAFATVALAELVLVFSIRLGTVRRRWQAPP